MMPRTIIFALPLTSFLSAHLASAQSATNVSAIIGTPGGGPQTSGDNLLASPSTQFNNPIALCIDPFGTIFVAEQGGHCVRSIAYTNGTLGLVRLVAGVEGSHGTSGDGGAASLAQLDSPYGLHCHSSGALYIADTNNHAVRLVSSYATALGPSITTISTWAGNLGHYGTIGDGA